MKRLICFERHYREKHRFQERERDGEEEGAGGRRGGEYVRRREMGRERQKTNWEGGERRHDNELYP